MPVTILFHSPIDYLRNGLNQPLGGAETAVLRMHAALVSLGVSVELVNEGATARYKDVLIVKRFPLDVMRYRPCFHRVYFWSPDDVTHATFAPLQSDDLVREFNRSVDGVFAISDFQYQRLVDRGIDQRKIIPTRYGVDINLFPRRTTLPGPVCIYSSSPNRGLSLIPTIWSYIHASVSTADLWVYSSLRTYRKPDDGLAYLYDELRALPRATYFGPVPQVELAAALNKARVFLYPNTYPETSSIATLEARAAGCGIVATHAGALPESAAGNILVEPKGTQQSFLQVMSDQAVRLLTDDGLYRAISSLNQESARTFDWRCIAREWLWQLHLES